MWQRIIKSYNKSWVTKTKNARSKLSNQYSVKKEITSIKFLSICSDPPIKANGTDPSRYGANNFKFKLPALI